MKVISVMNRKGGVGKSTVTVLLATILSKDYRVCVLDCDNQRTIWQTRSFETSVQETEIKPPYPVDDISPTFVHTHLKRIQNDYDYVFIDMPRMTDDSRDSATVQMLTYCDLVLVPILAGRADVFSVLDFIEILKGIEEFKVNADFEFKFYGFMNKVNNRTENRDSKKYLERQGLKMMKEELKDLKIFLTPSTYESILETAEGKNRFEAFYNEFKTLI